MREVEFLPEWYPAVRRRKRMVAMQAWATLILVCGLGLWTMFSQQRVAARELELGKLRADFDQSETELERLGELLELQRRLGYQDGIFLRIGRPVEATRLLTTLDEVMPRDMTLLELTVDTEEAPMLPAGTLAARAQQRQKREGKDFAESRLRLRLRGVAPTDVDLAEFLRMVTARPFFKNVELLYSHEKQQEGRIMREFEVSFMMELSGSAAPAAGGR